MALAIAGLLASSVPADASWLARGIGIGGIGYSLKKNLGDAIEALSDMTQAVMNDNRQDFLKAEERINSLPKNLVVDSFPVLSGPNRIVMAARTHWASFKNRIQGFLSGADNTVIDNRLALAVGKKDRNWLESNTGILNLNPLPSVSGTKFVIVPAEKSERSANNTGSWSEWQPKPEYQLPVRETAADSRSEYEIALADTFGDNSAILAEEINYEAALENLDAKELARQTEAEREAAQKPEERRQQVGTIATQSQVHAFDCDLPDPDVASAIQESTQRGKSGGAAEAYCGAANIAWIVSWYTQQYISACNKTGLELQQLQQQLDESKRTGQQNAEGYRLLTDGGLECECWYSYCLK